MHLFTKYRNECLLVLLILLAASAMLWRQAHSRNTGTAARAQVSVDGQPTETIDLQTDGEYTIQGAGGGSNHLVVEDGQIWCDEATCPDQVCVRQGKQSLDGSTIVCLPNRVIVQVIYSESSSAG